MNVSIIVIKSSFKRLWTSCPATPYRTASANNSVRPLFVSFSGTTPCYTICGDKWRRHTSSASAPVLLETGGISITSSIIDVPTRVTIDHSMLGCWCNHQTVSSRNACCVIETRGQSNLTKSASRGAHSPVRGHPRGSKVVPLNSWGRVSY